MPGDFDEAAEYEDEDLELAQDEELEEEAGDDDDDADDKPAANRWNARRSLAAHMDEVTTGKESKGPTAEGEDDDDEEDTTQEQKPQPPKAEDKEPAAPTTARYARLDAEGKPVAEPLLATGQVIQFKGDGKEIKVSSDDELIQLAQKGAAFDRKTSEQGKRISALEETVRSTQATAEETLLRILFGYTKEDGTVVTPREARELLRPKLAQFRDPEYRKGQEALAREEARIAAEKAEQEQTVEETRTEFWTQVGEEIGGALPEFEHLTEEHAQDISARFYASYTSTFERAIAAGDDQETANAKAFEQLTSANLRRVMRGLNAELADGTPAPKKKDPAAEADAHNRRVRSKVESRRTAPRLAGGGAAPGNRAPAPASPAKEPLKPGETLFQRRMKGALSTLRSAASDE